VGERSLAARRASAFVGKIARMSKIEPGQDARHSGKRVRVIEIEKDRARVQAVDDEWGSGVHTAHLSTPYWVPIADLEAIEE
jgi:hypothetical protein